jgi:methylmalonyl-CoA mutase
MSSEGTLTDDSFPAITIAEWRQRVAERLDGVDQAALESVTIDGVAISALYAESLASPSALRSAGPSSGSTACVLIDDADPAQAEARLRSSLAVGAGGMYLRLDRSTRQGLDAGEEAAAGHLGVEGLVLGDRHELAVALGDNRVGGLEVWLEAGANALPVTAIWLAELERRGCPVGEVALHCGADPLGALATDGTLPRDLMKLESEMAVLARFSSRHLPRGRAITVSTQVYQEAGATLSAQLGYAVATTLEYLRGLEDSGLNPTEAASQICWRFALGTNVFSEMAKLRAARTLWRMVWVACGVSEPPPARIHAVSSWRSLTRRAPMNNSLRATGQMFSASCGGADAVTLQVAVDQGAAAAGAVRLATTTHAILREEAHLERASDPGAGSHFVESLTADLARAGWAEAQQIESAGGMRECLLSGQITASVEADGEDRRRAFESEEAAITGVTRYAGREQPAARTPLDTEALRASIEQRRVSVEASAGIPTSAEVHYSRDFVVEELVAQARRGGTVAALAAQLGDAEGAESCSPMVRGRDAGPYEDTGGGELG